MEFIGNKTREQSTSEVPVYATWTRIKMKKGLPDIQEAGECGFFSNKKQYFDKHGCHSGLDPESPRLVEQRHPGRRPGIDSASLRLAEL